MATGFINGAVSVDDAATSRANLEVVKEAASSTDNAIPRFDGTGGDAVQNSGVTISDTDVCSGITQLNVDNITIDGNTISNASASITLDPLANVAISKSLVGGLLAFNITNTDNTNGGSNALVTLQAGGASGGDPYIAVGILSARAYGWGIDNSNSDVLNEVTQAASTTDPSGGTIVRQITSAGEITMPLQPGFSAYFESQAANVTGNGTNYIFGDTDVGGGVSMTEYFDQGGDFVTGSASGATLTAPVTARWLFTTSCLFTSATLATDLDYYISTSNSNFRGAKLAPATITSGGTYDVSQSVVATMDAADTATVVVNLNGVGADTADIYGGANDPRSTFTGWQLG